VDNSRESKNSALRKVFADDCLSGKEVKAVAALIDALEPFGIGAYVQAINEDHRDHPLFELVIAVNPQG